MNGIQIIQLFYLFFTLEWISNSDKIAESGIIHYVTLNNGFPLTFIWINSSRILYCESLYKLTL